MTRPMMALAVAVAMAFGACGTEEPSPDDAPITVKILAHGSWVTAEGIFEPLLQDGIKVEVITSGDAGALTNEVILDAENPRADVVYGIDNTFLGRALANDVFGVHDYNTTGIATWLLDGIDQSRVVPVDYGDVCVNYDIRWFAERQIAPPTNLDDLIDPVYKDLTVVPDPNLSSPGLAFLLATVDRYADAWDDYWSDLNANGVQVVDGWSTSWYTEFTVSGGTRPIVVSYASSPPADVMFSDPPRTEPLVAAVDDGCFRQVEFAGVSRNSKHASEAVKVIDFMLSEAFQADVPANMFVFPAREHVRLPEVFDAFALRPTAPVRMSVERSEELRDETIARWTEVVLK